MWHRAVLQTSQINLSWRRVAKERPFCRYFRLDVTPDPPGPGQMRPAVRICLQFPVPGHRKLQTNRRSSPPGRGSRRERAELTTSTPPETHRNHVISERDRDDTCAVNAQ